MTFREGQKYQIADYEAPDAALTICKIEDDPAFGRIFHVCLDGVRLQTPYAPVKFATWVAHLAFSEEAVRESVGRLICEHAFPHNWQPGYENWRRGFEAGETSIWMTTVPHTLMSLAEGMEKKAS